MVDFTRQNFAPSPVPDGPGKLTKLQQTRRFFDSGATPPVLISLNPATGADVTSIVINGTGFLQNGAQTPTVIWDGTIFIPSIFLSSTQLSFTPPPGSTVNPGTHTVQVQNPPM